MSAADSGSPFRSRGFIGAAIIVGVIVLAAVIVLATSLFRGSNDAAPSPSPSTSATSAASDADPSVCGLDGYEDTSSLTSAPDNEWELVGTVAAPVGTGGAGPGVTESNGFRSCYAHTAEGALFATVGYVAVSSDSRNNARLYELLAAGTVREELESSPASADPSATRLQVAGFRVLSYSLSEAIIDVAWTVTSDGNALVSLPTVVKWEDGDWKIFIGDDGPPFAPSPLENLGGYIPWAGV